MKKMLVLLFCWQICCPAAAWQFYNGTDSVQLQPGYAILEPDNWSRADLSQMLERGIKPLAWLNCAQNETRLVQIDVKPKDYLVSGRYLPGSKSLALFYSPAFRALLAVRIREYLAKGFAGIVFAKLGMYDALSNSPGNRGEMWRLVADLSKECRRLNSSSLQFVHDAGDFVAEIRANPLISGVVEEGLYFGRSGRQVKPWQQKKRLEWLHQLRSEGYQILLAEDARNEKRQLQAVTACEQEGFDCGFAFLPLDIERKKVNGQKK